MWSCFGVVGINAGGLNKTDICGVQCVTRVYVRVCVCVYVVFMVCDALQGT